MLLNIYQTWVEIKVWTMVFNQRKWPNQLLESRLLISQHHHSHINKHKLGKRTKINLLMFSHNLLKPNQQIVKILPLIRTKSHNWEVANQALRIHKEAKDIILLAETEGLDAHANSIKERLKKKWVSSAGREIYRNPIGDIAVRLRGRFL